MFLWWIVYSQLNELKFIHPKLTSMGQSLVKNYMHIVFSTKHRQNFILPPVEEELHAYLGGVCNELECPPIKIGGYTDHVHILCMLSKKRLLKEPPNGQA